MMKILRDVYELKDGKPTIKSKGTEAYYRLLEYFDKILEDYTLTDENKNTIKVSKYFFFFVFYLFAQVRIITFLFLRYSLN